jgi:putative protease
MTASSHQAPQPYPELNVKNKPELLAPAGNWDCAKAAVENGADAIYFGLDSFNARMRADNFSEADLPELMTFLHRRGVKGYVTLNTLVFPAELQEAEQYLKTMITVGVDAVIVQDIGICRLIRHLSPDFPIHASTQMTVTSAAGVEFAKELGCQLVVLARECSLKDINKIQAQLQTKNLALPLEVFVHGALCVAYSGQCLTSEALGGRSANRGECAQACRMTYDLIADGELVDLGDRKYLLSPQDLSGLDVLPELMAAGVSCLKIEGRLKAPEYVASVTRIYRQALDRTLATTSRNLQSKTSGATPKLQPNDPSLPTPHPLLTPKLPSPSTSPLSTPLSLSPSETYQLEMAFSRGLYTGWFQGIDNQTLVHGRFGKKRGVFLGEVSRVNQDSVWLQLHAPLKPGDGVVFDNGNPSAPEEGGRVYQVQQQGKLTQIQFGRRNVNLKRIHPGDKVWKTSDPALEKEIQQTYTGDQPKFKRSLSLEVHGEVGQAMTIIARDSLGHIVRVESSLSLVAAHSKPLMTNRLQQQLSRLGNTPFFLDALTNHLQGDVMLPVSELNRLRRDLVEKMDRARSQPPRWHLNASQSLRSLLPVHLPAAPTSPTAPTSPIALSPPHLHLLVRNRTQLAAALHAGIDTIYCEFENPATYRDAVQWFRAHRICESQTIWVAPPRIAKPLEHYILDQVRRSDADGYLIRNYDQLAYFADQRCIGDFSLNVANALTADYLVTNYGLERLTASYDLNADQLEDLLRSAPPPWFEITLHQHMPMFHMEHCVFCAFLSDGKDFRDCGRPCETHQVKLRDRVGTEHVLQADAGCRNTVFNGVAQTGAEYFQRLIEAGARYFRLEFLDETPGQVVQTIQSYQQLLSGEITGTQLWRRLNVQNQLGVTRGTIHSPHTRRRKTAKN